MVHHLEESGREYRWNRELSSVSHGQGGGRAGWRRRKHVSESLATCPGEALGGDRLRELLSERPGGPECPTGEAAGRPLQGGKETKLCVAAKNQPVWRAAPQMPSGPRDPRSPSRHEVTPASAEMESPVKKHNPKGDPHPLGQPVVQKKCQEQELQVVLGSIC